MFRLPLALTLSLLALPLHSPSVHAATPAVKVLIVLPALAHLPRMFSLITGEAASIWRAADVEIQWAERLPDSNAPVDRIITLLFTNNLPGRSAQTPGALGAVQLVHGRMRQLIYVSPAAVQVLVAKAGVSPATGHFDVVYARMLGRVIAHELGHLLLNTSAHRDSGVMRAKFVARDAMSGDVNRFALAADDVARLAGLRLARAEPPATGPPASAPSEPAPPRR